MPSAKMSDFSRSCLIFSTLVGYSDRVTKAFHKIGEKYTGVPTIVFFKLSCMLSSCRLFETPKSVIFGIRLSASKISIFSGLISLIYRKLENTYEKFFSFPLIQKM